jgi:hypothetical protein
MSTLEDKIEAVSQTTKVELVEDDGLSAVNLSAWSIKNKRVAPRYIRDDIVVALCEITHLSFGKEVFIDFVKLNDITSRGMSFSSNQHITIHKKIVLNLRFRTEVTFKIPASIIYRINASPYQYGVKFDYDHQNLSDHLLETQSKLVFR